MVHRGDRLSRKETLPTMLFSPASATAIATVTLAVAITLSVVSSALATGTDDPLRVKPPALPSPGSPGVLESEIRRLCLRQLGADCRERLAFEGGGYLPELFGRAEPGRRMREHQIRPYTSLAYAGAVAIMLGEYGEAETAISRREMARITLSLVRELAAHHVANTDRTSWWWGDEWQSALWASAMARGAWLVWDRLPPAVRNDVARMVVFEADRFLGAPAPFSEFSDSKAEENAWNSQILVFACCALPDHSNRAAWAEKAIEYMVTAYAAPQDVESDRMVDGRPLREWLRGPNVHSDYSLENHGFFHPDYVAARCLTDCNAIVYRLAGMDVPESALFNAEQCRDLLNLLTLPNGWTFYPQGTDWSNYRHDVTIMAQAMNPVLPNPAGARCLRWGLDFIDWADRSAPGEPVNLFRGINFNCCPLSILADLYLMHHLFGPGADPLPDSDARKRLAGTRLFADGKCVICRSEKGMASFSWFDSGRRLMAVVTPLANDAFCLPKSRSLIGTIGDGHDAVRITAQEVDLLADGGFTARMALERGPEHRLKERVAMVALPDGRVVYAEWFAQGWEGSLGEVRTGLVFFENRPFWLRGGMPTLLYPGGEWNLGDGPLVLDPGASRWVNLGDRLGIVVHGSKAMRIDDGQISLNYSATGAPGSLPEQMIAVFLPGASSRTTAALSARLRVSSLPDGRAGVHLGDMTVELDPRSGYGAVRGRD